MQKKNSQIEKIARAPRANRDQHRRSSAVGRLLHTCATGGSDTAEANSDVTEFSGRLSVTDRPIAAPNTD